MANRSQASLKFKGYGVQDGIVSLLDTFGRHTQIHVRELASRGELIEALSPSDAFTVGNWHAHYMEHWRVNHG